MIDVNISPKTYWLKKFNHCGNPRKVFIISSYIVDYDNMSNSKVVVSDEFGKFEKLLSWIDFCRSYIRCMDKERVL